MVILNGDLTNKVYSHSLGWDKDFGLKQDRGIAMKIKLLIFSVICIFYAAASAGTTADLPANSRVFISEEDCLEVMKLHYSWNIDFASRLRNMEKSGKFIKYPQKVPINIIETKSYKGHQYYNISIYNKLTDKHDIVWTDAPKLD